MIRGGCRVTAHCLQTMGIGAEGDDFSPQFPVTQQDLILGIKLSQLLKIGGVDLQPDVPTKGGF